MNSLNFSETPTLSQSEVCWQQHQNQTPTSSPKLTTASPKRRNKRLSSCDSIKTPIRIVRRHMSSPVITRSFLEEPGLTNKNPVTITKCTDEFNYDLDDDEILAAVHEAEILEEKAATQRQNSELKRSTEAERKKSKSKTFNEKREMQALLEDSFDDAFLNSIPLDDLREQSTADKGSSCFDVIYKDMKELGIVVADKSSTSSSSLSRYTSEPSFSITKFAVKRPAVMNPTKLFERHNSLPSTQQAKKSTPEIAQIRTDLPTKSITADTSPVKNDSVRPRK